MAKPLLLGHRGARNYAPENTIEAFEQALADGCDGFEFDVRLTADQIAVVCHDPTYRRLALSRSSYAKLQEKSPDLCTLESVLTGFRNRAFLNVELKVAGAEELLIELLREHPAKKGLIVSSFLPSIVLRLHELGASFPLGIICENRRQLARWKELPVQAVMVERGLVTRKLVDEMRTTPLKPTQGLNGALDAPRQIFVWTVNSARDMKKFAAMGVDGIISDDTKLLAKTLG